MIIKFANQIRALDFFEQHVHSEEPFFYVVEPAEMGKSSFLSEVVNYCEHNDISPCPRHNDGCLKSREPESWRTVQVDFSASKKINGNSFTVARLYGSILDEMQITGSVSLKSVLDALRKYMDIERKRTLLLFDGGEYLNDEVATALHHFLAQCMKAFEPTPAFCPAVLIAARRAFSAWEAGYGPQLKKLELSPFAPTDVIVILEKAREGSIPWERAIYHDYACRIFESSMGHPGCTSEIIVQLRNDDFMEREPDSNEYFTRVVVPYIEKRILNRDHLANHRKLGKTDRELLGKVLRELSTYRIIIPAWINSAARRINPSISIEELERLGHQIENCPLVTQDYVQYGWSFLSPSVRKLLERWLSLECRERHMRHRQAAEGYREWLDTHEESAARKAPALEDSIAILIELLYHVTISSTLRENAFLVYLGDILHENKDKLAPWFPGQKTELILRTRLSRDSELRALIIERTSAKGFETLLRGI